MNIGIVGYGNLGKAVRGLLEKENKNIVKIFTRRDPASFGDKVFESLDNLLDYKDKIDVLFLTLGSATDIPELAPQIIENFNTIDAYDNHAHIPEYFEKMNEIAKNNNKVAFISTGWDPGLFSLNRLMGEAVLRDGYTNTFWGKGVSQGHSDAVRRIKGVKKAVQYTISKEEIIENIKDADKSYASYEGHDRLCYVVCDKDDEERIRDEIVNMEDYFKPYHTDVKFISDEEFEKNHRAMPHGGHVIRTGNTLNGNREMYKFTLELDSNPEFTASVMIMAANAVANYVVNKNYGAHTNLDTPPYYYLGCAHEEAISKYL
ncbi:diaminopimelate dehydrogenase [Peptoniphilus sp. MSJ-1]|uniref:Meso-diaminopimelate D-dehydrogenase n=1 Tax=Peptoniphilus ovalis TaxID=2841503 RepID=A0ABS6FIS4_9FIRM|nr:diaminopimelate dehydrogenase [Peptoniphilus ovalis]MBU5670070.1 diaminopimelate dehydrogenase [Peptoniphilus ovalis]